MSGLKKPTSKGLRDHLSDQQQNGRIQNPPRMARLGGFNSTRKGFSKNGMKIVKPGGSAA